MPPRTPASRAAIVLVTTALLYSCATVVPLAPTAADKTDVAAAAAAGAAAAVRGAAPSPASQAPGAAPAPTPATSAAAAAAGAAAAAANGAKPFAEVIKDAKETKGLYTLYEKDDKVWIELAPEQMDVPFFFTANLAQGLGENFIFGGLMGGYAGWPGQAQIATWHKQGNNVQLVARNEEYFAKTGTPAALAVREAFSDSLLGAVPIASRPHPERKSVLIELSALLLADIPGANGVLERNFRQPYSFDARNSAITRTHVAADAIGAAVTAHYSLSRVIQPPAPPSTAKYTPPPSTIPDVRSLFLGYYYTFAKLPDQVMAPRLADARIGYFTTTRNDFSSDNTLSPRRNYVSRWRLEKQDPAAPLSAPKQPIVFWLDKNIPEQYRDTVIAGVLEWNKAFAKIGFKDAVQAKIQPADADFDTLDSRHASIRWMVTAKPAFGGIGPIQVDPRSGEILDADIGIDPVRIRNRRAYFGDQVTMPAGNMTTPFPQTACMRNEISAQEVGFALDLLEARGDILPDSAAEQQFVLADLKDTVMHEVGHTLGLTHNFRASTIYSRAQLDDAEFTRAHGIAGSVMEYNAINLSMAGEKQGSFSMDTLGPYDYWAIEYGYKEVAAGDEAIELRRIAGRSAEHDLAYAYDEETALGYDPDAAASDLSDDPLEFARRRVVLARELWSRWEKRDLADGASLSRYRRNVTRGLIAIREGGTAAARYVGGVSLLRDAAGSGRTPINPVDPAQQRAALALIASTVFSADSFRFSPAFLRKLSPDWLNRNDPYDGGLDSPGYDYSLPKQVLAVQMAVLDRVMSDGVAARILSSESKVDAGKRALQMSELYGALHHAIFSELATGQDIPQLRRNLQREYVERLGDALLRPRPTLPPDALAVIRADARSLRDELTLAQRKRVYSAEARAHLAESLQTLDEALKAPMVRTVL